MESKLTEEQRSICVKEIRNLFRETKQEAIKRKERRNEQSQLKKEGVPGIEKGRAFDYARDEIELWEVNHALRHNSKNGEYKMVESLFGGGNQTKPQRKKNKDPKDPEDRNSPKKDGDYEDPKDPDGTIEFRPSIAWLTTNGFTVVARRLFYNHPSYNVDRLFVRCPEISK